MSSRANTIWRASACGWHLPQCAIYFAVEDAPRPQRRCTPPLSPGALSAPQGPAASSSRSVEPAAGPAAAPTLSEGDSPATTLVGLGGTAWRVEGTQTAMRRMSTGTHFSCDCAGPTRWRRRVEYLPTKSCTATRTLNSVSRASIRQSHDSH